MRHIIENNGLPFQESRNCNEVKRMNVQLNGIEELQEEKVIKIILNIGSGKDLNDRVRRVAQYWTLDGRFIGEVKI